MVIHKILPQNFIDKLQLASIGEQARARYMPTAMFDTCNGWRQVLTLLVATTEVVSNWSPPHYGYNYIIFYQFSPFCISFCTVSVVDYDSQPYPGGNFEHCLKNCMLPWQPNKHLLNTPNKEHSQNSYKFKALVILRI